MILLSEIDLDAFLSWRFIPCVVWLGAELWPTFITSYRQSVAQPSTPNNTVGGLPEYTPQAAATTKATLLSQWGFSFKKYNEGEWWRVFSHALVHLNDEHFTANCVMYAAAAIQFTPFSCKGVRDTLTKPLTIGEGLVGLAVMASGCIGGVLGMSTLQEWNNRRVGDNWDIGISLVSKVAKKIHKTQNDLGFMCGASSAIYALTTFNLVNNSRDPMSNPLRWVSTVFLLLPEVTNLITAERDTPSVLSTSASGVRVGHAAHIGGAIAGAAFALWWRRVGHKSFAVLGTRRQYGNQQSSNIGSGRRLGTDVESDLIP